MNPEGIVRQFELSWDMLDEIMSRCSDPVWRAELPQPYSIGRLCFHVIQSTARYCRAGKQRADLDPFGFGGNELKVRMDTFPSADEMKVYSRKVRKRTLAWLGSLDAVALGTNDGAFQWTGRSVGERVLYTLKHFHHHLGQMNLLLRMQGIDRVEWRCVTR